VSGIREGNWKLLEYLDDSHLELYNLSSDESETINLVSKNPEKAKQLRLKMQNWRASVGAQGIVPNPQFKQIK
jgi:arylsulfatase A-like enzyme